MQFCVHVPVLHDIAPHADPPSHAAVHVPDVHVMLPHARAPVHVTSHGFVLHVMPRHASSDVQLMSHEIAFAQLIAPHAPGVAQLMMQFQPAGHEMLPVPAPVIVHSDFAKSHLPAQIAGHTAASIGTGPSGRVPSTQ